MAIDRTLELRERVGNSNDADFIMENIIELFTEQELVPDTGLYYTFVYIPKTPNITYDQYPLVAVTDIFQWGFRGINYHWRSYRNYTWAEIVGQLHRVYHGELDYMRELSYEKMLTK